MSLKYQNKLLLKLESRTISKSIDNYISLDSGDDWMEKRKGYDSASKRMYQQKLGY